MRLGAGGHLWSILKCSSIFADGDSVDTGLSLNPSVGPAKTYHAFNYALFVHPQNVSHAAFPSSYEKGKGGSYWFWGGLF